MDNVIGIIQGFARESGKNKLIQKTGFCEKFWNFMKYYFFITIPVTFLGKDMNLMIFGETPCNLNTVAFHAAGCNKPSDENSDF
jgi:hypothetical protein